MDAGSGHPSQERYIPAAGRAMFTGIYDTVSDLTTREGTWHPPLVDSVLEDGSVDRVVMTLLLQPDACPASSPQPVSPSR